ncbi:Uncharacterized protein TCM_019349 [Theobroma cacao]|uniref:Uncharacterized protein n=1 Tax=Theobroma cacao TaxID=3641 RepID=A0A061EI38_THECC|nr:Uncharacterized protein TCM_019349 [Theobroma cacao]
MRQYNGHSRDKPQKWQHGSIEEEQLWTMHGTLFSFCLIFVPLGFFSFRFLMKQYNGHLRGSVMNISEYLLYFIISNVSSQIQCV